MNVNKLAVFAWALVMVLVVGPRVETTVESAGSEQAKFFPVSVWYSGGKARAPMLEPVNTGSAAAWSEDLRKIKGLGFNTIRTWVEWNTGEPREGEYHLENLDLLLKLAEQAGLKVMVQVYVDSAPEWVGAKYPDGRYAAQDGQPIPAQAAPGYCFDHAGVRDAILNFYREVARHAEESPAFYGWDLWSEPAALNWARVGYKAEPMFCYCPSSIARFRAWLQQKYGSLDRLNEAWHRTFTDWRQVEPPRYGTILTYADFMDWRVFYGEKLAQDLKARNDAVKQVDAGHVTMSHAPNPSPLVRTLADPYDPTDDYLMKDSVDLFGTSFYPKLTAQEHNWTLERRVLAMDLTASITGGRGFVVGELQSGYGIHGTTVGSPVTASDLEMWTWGMVSRGARAINYYAFYPMNAGYESGGYGMINLDGSLTERSRHAGEIAKEISANADLLLDAKPEPAEAAVVFSPLAPLVGGYDEEGSRTAMHQAVAGYHRMFFERNLRLDVLSARELGQDHLERYRLVIVPYPLMLTEEEANALRAYAEGGGHLFVEARPGWVDERGHAQIRVPGFGWDQMLGLREKQVTPGKEFAVRWGTATFKAMTFAEQFEAEGASAQAVATLEDGTPVAYESKTGKGSAIVFGSFAGHENYREPVKMHPLGDILANWAGLSRPQLDAPPLVELREMKAPQGRVVFLFNHGDKAARVQFARELEKPAKAVREIATGATVPADGSHLRITAEVPPGSVGVYRIDY
ncbi:beta-galactosidase [Occallatibacter riparius]|uniref:beta-galactosidase n=1 Tax=Occallatibacter riparius TaxID=1002689 RepID=A0A9J7BQH2_9BACT|nr:beta-galactosidase [Occallatibacter riparius]UWZ85051.1 beta-galactosidase [Occallatibacter riparius]